MKFKLLWFLFIVLLLSGCSTHVPQKYDPLKEYCESSEFLKCSDIPVDYEFRCFENGYCITDSFILCNGQPYFAFKEHNSHGTGRICMPIKNETVSELKLLEGIYLVGENVYIAGICSNCNKEPVLEVDKESFKHVLATKNNLFAKDSNSVIINGLRVLDSDPNTFVAYNSGYSKDKNHVYYSNGGNSNIIINSADPKSFEVINCDLNYTYYAKDANNVYLYGSIISGADSDSFEIINCSNYAKDKNAVFFSKNKLEGADPISFVLRDKLSAFDKDYCFEGDTKIDRRYWCPNNVVKRPDNLNIPQDIYDKAVEILIKYYGEDFFTKYIIYKEAITHYKKKIYLEGAEKDRIAKNYDVDYSGIYTQGIQDEKYGEVLISVKYGKITTMSYTKPEKSYELRFFIEHPSLTELDKVVNSLKVYLDSTGNLTLYHSDLLNCANYPSKCPPFNISKEDAFNIAKDAFPSLREDVYISARFGHDFLNKDFEGFAWVINTVKFPQTVDETNIIEIDMETGEFIHNPFE